LNKDETDKEAVLDENDTEDIGETTDELETDNRADADVVSGEAGYTFLYLLLVFSAIVAIVFMNKRCTID